MRQGNSGNGGSEVQQRMGDGNCRLLLGSNFLRVWWRCVGNLEKIRVGVGF